MHKKPVLTEDQKKLTDKTPKLNDDVIVDDAWHFSFKFFNQIEKFGLDKQKPDWFVSVLERLKELSSKNKDSFFTNTKERSDYRYHAVDWSKKNVPIERSDLIWVDKTYLSDEQTYPIMQITVSKALGRIVGFWNETNTVFYVILLDPLHNIQPSGGKFSYKIHNCSPLKCRYSTLLAKNESLIQKLEDKKYLQSLEIVKDKLKTPLNDSVLLVSIDEEFTEILYDKIEKGISLKTIIERGLLS